MTVQPGDCVQITGVMPNEPEPLPVGALGIVVRVLDSGRQADVRWDSGRTLLLLLGVDPYRIVHTCEGMVQQPEPDETSNTQSPRETQSPEAETS